MSVFQSPDRAAFLANRQPGAQIRVVRMPSVQAVRREGRVEKVPAIELTYSFVKGEQEWVFHETRLAENGRVNLDGTLWEDLEREGGYQLLHRSGSF